MRSNLEKSCMCLFIAVNSLGLIGNVLPFPFDVGIVEAHANPGMLPSDGDAWTENDNATYPWTETWHSELSFTTSDVKKNSYSLNATHTSSQTKMNLLLILQSSVNLSTFDYISFWIKCPVAKTFVLTVYKVSTSNSFKVDIAPRTGWDLYIIRLKSFRIQGSPSWSDITKFSFCWSYGLTAYGNETFLIDGLHAGDYTSPTTTNSINELLLPRFGYFAHNMTWEPEMGFPESLYAEKRTDTNERSNGLEVETLGTNAFLYCLAYNISGFSFYLDKAKIWANALEAFQNDTEGTRGYGGWTRQRYVQDHNAGINAWVLMGLIYTYHFTNNNTIKTWCQNGKRWFIDVMWNSTNNCFNKKYFPDTDTILYSTGFVASHDPLIAGVMAAYIKWIESNSTILSIVNNVLNQWLSEADYATFSTGLTESDSYGYWGVYHGFLATSNQSYKNSFINGTYHLMDIYLRSPSQNGSITAMGSRYRWYDEPDQKLSGWGHMIGLLHLGLVYEWTSESFLTSLLSKMLWDYVYDAQTSDGSITFYRNAVGSYADYNKIQYTPTSASVVAAILWYYENVAKPHPTTYLIDATEKITAVTHTEAEMRFTVNATAGKTSTTLVYSTLKPTNVYGATSYSYNSTSKLLTITVTHSSEHEVIVVWLDTGVGGVVVPTDKIGLLTPYIGATLTIIVAAIATAVDVKRAKHRKDKQ